MDKRFRFGYDPVANFHIAKYRAGSSDSAYVWESEQNRVVFDTCMDSWRQVAGEAAQAMRNFVRTLLDNADWMAFLIIAAVVIAVIIALILIMPAVVLADLGSPGLEPTAETLTPADPAPSSERR